MNKLDFDMRNLLVNPKIMCFVVFLFFLLGSIFGGILTLSYDDSFFNNSGLLMEKPNGFSGMIKVFSNNLKGCLILILGLFVMGSITVVSLFFNGMLVGITITNLYIQNVSLSKLFLGIFTHGIFEIPAIIIAGYIGLQGFTFYFRKNKMWKKNSKLVFIIIVLLFIAAFIESFVTPWVIK